jgi:hypothetical protein
VPKEWRISWRGRACWGSRGILIRIRQIFWKKCPACRRRLGSKTHRTLSRTYTCVRRYSRSFWQNFCRICARKTLAKTDTLAYLLSCEDSTLTTVRATFLGLSLLSSCSTRTELPDSPAHFHKVTFDSGDSVENSLKKVLCHRTFEGAWFNIRSWTYQDAIIHTALHMSFSRSSVDQTTSLWCDRAKSFSSPQTLSILQRKFEHYDMLQRQFRDFRKRFLLWKGKLNRSWVSRLWNGFSRNSVTFENKFLIWKRTLLWCHRLSFNTRITSLLYFQRRRPCDCDFEHEKEHFRPL